ncbi:MFS transporter [Actinomycetes bacterium]|nr:MFS transporter [Actinomycetes bacterium]
MAENRGSTFRSLKHFNARLFFFSLLVSNIGSWLQLTASSLLLYRLTGSAADLGYNVAFQFLPMLLFGTWCGALADRHNRRRIAIITQSALAVQAFLLGVLDLTGAINVPIVFALSLMLGIIGAFDNPARRGLVTELVPPVDLPNAMSLNTAVMTGSRVFGAAIATLLVVPLGTGWLFILNGVSYSAMIYGLTGLRKSEMFPAMQRPAGGSPVRDVFKYVAGNRRLLTMFSVYLIVSTFAFNYGVALPKLADVRWGDARAFGWIMATTGIGNLAGALLTARLQVVTMKWFVSAITLLGASGIGLAFAPNIYVAFLWSLPLGLGGAAMIASGNAISQQESPPDMRGRLLALTAVAFLGSTPIGGPITGLIADNISPEWSLAYGGVITLISAAVVVIAWR